MSYHDDGARSQQSDHCARFGELLDGGDFPDFADELVSLWREFNAVCQRYLNATCELNAFAAELELLGDVRFRCIKLPIGAVAPLYLGEAASEDQVRRNPSIILGLPQKRRAIDRLKKSTRREAS